MKTMLEIRELKLLQNIIRKIKRVGIRELWGNYDHKYIMSPSSTKFHGCYEGGLAVHSIQVFKNFNKLLEVAGVRLDYDTIAICSLFHDICKVDAYIFGEKEIRKNPNADKGHALLSIYRIQRFLQLTELEKNIIKYHMGIFGLDEYKLEELQRKTNENHILQIFACADMMASRQEKRVKG